MEDDKDIMLLSEKHPIVFYDNVCYLCDKSVTFILSKDKLSTFRFCALQTAITYDKISDFIDLKTKNSVILLHKGIFYDKSDAAIRIMILLGGWISWLGYFSFLFPSFIRNAVYNIVAKYRYLWFGKSDTCLLPNPKFTAQFLHLET